MTLPNKITIFRVAAIPLFLFFLLTAEPIYNSYIAAGLFIFLALTDAVDGFLARFLRQTSDLGKFLDPLADKILMLSALIGLLGLRVIPALPVIIITIRELAVMGLRVMAASSGMIIAASTSAKWKTVVLMIAVPMLILGIPYGVAVLWIAVVLSMISGIEYFRNFRSLA